MAFSICSCCSLWMLKTSTPFLDNIRYLFFSLSYANSKETRSFLIKRLTLWVTALLDTSSNPDNFTRFTGWFRPIRSIKRTSLIVWLIYQYLFLCWSFFNRSKAKAKLLKHLLNLCSSFLFIVSFFLLMVLQNIVFLSRRVKNPPELSSEGFTFISQQC